MSCGRKQFQCLLHGFTFLLFLCTASLGQTVDENNSTEEDSTTSTFKTGESLGVQITVRDFLPSWCMPDDVYIEAWNNLPPQFLPHNSEGYHQGILREELENGTNSRDCPYFEYIQNGTVSGHPFMEDAHFSGGRDFIASIFGAQLKRATSGLWKPQHCSVDDSCGLGLNPGKKEDFDALFTDVKKYNKRSGFILKLLQDENSESFTYDSQDPLCEENLQFAEINDTDFDLLEPFILRPSFQNDSEDVPERFFGPVDRFIQPNTSYEITQDKFPDPFRAYLEAWPQIPRSVVPSGAIWSQDHRIERTKHHKFWFTAEIHTTFEYKGGEVFNFNVQDMAWVYINNQLASAIEASNQTRAAFIELDNISNEFGLEVGGIYTLDAFQIEKHTGGSTWFFQSNLVEACNVIQSGSLIEDLSFSTTLSNVERQLTTIEEYFTFSGVKFGSDEVQMLTDSAFSTFSTNYIFFNQQINSGAGFILEFSFRLTVGTDGGFAVVFHRRKDGLKNLPISGPSQMGFKGYENSIAIAFDLCPDRAPLVCEEQEVRVHYNDVHLQQAEANDTEAVESEDEFNPFATTNGVSNRTLKVSDKVLGNLKTEREHRVRIEYLETPDHLNVFIDDSLYLREDGFNLEDVIGGRNAFIGFTSGQSILTTDLFIKDLEVRTVNIDAEKTVLAAEEEETEEEDVATLFADGASFIDHAIQTRDFCGNLIQFGGDSERITVELLSVPSEEAEFRRVLSMRRQLQEEAEEEEEGEGEAIEGEIEQEESAFVVEVIDNDDGSYIARVTSTEPGSFGLFISHGDDCLTFEEFSDEPTVPEDGCTYIDIGLAGISLETLPPTAAPSFSIDLGDAVESRALFFIVIIGALLLCTLLIWAVIMRKYKVKWDKEKHLVPIGIQEILDRGQNYGENEVLADLNKENEHVRLEILKENAKGTRSLAQKRHINKMKTMNEQLHETIVEKTKSREVAVAINRDDEFLVHSGEAEERRKIRKKKNAPTEM